jgi:tetratricopeptide (TPR) repeat protein
MPISPAPSNIINDESARLEYGVRLFSQQKFPEALAVFQSLTEKKISILKQFYLGLTLIQLGRFEEGLAAYRQIREISSEDTNEGILYKLYLNMGSILQVLAKKKKNAEMYLEAKSCYKSALKIADDDPKLWNNLGNVQLDLEEYEDAIKCFRKAISMDDTFAGPHYCLSLVYEFTQRYPEAIAELEHAIRLNPKDTFFLNRIAALHFGIGQFEKARNYTKQVVEIDPKDVNANKHMALVCYNLKDYAVAFEYYRKLITIKPDYDETETRTIFSDLKKRMQK